MVGFFSLSLSLMRSNNRNFTYVCTVLAIAIKWRDGEIIIDNLVSWLKTVSFKNL